MKRTVPILFLICLLLCGYGLFVDKAEANYLSVSNVSLTDSGLSRGTAKVQLDISWDNSWWTTGVPNNYDAAWVFIKYSTDSGTTWTHATLKSGGTNPAGFSFGTGTALDIIVPGDKKGAFLQRSTPGTGDVSTNDIQLVWDYEADGVSDSASPQVKVFAIEMVYVPQGSFFVGLADYNTTNAFNNAAFYTWSNVGTPYHITSEAAITLGTADGNLCWSLRANSGDLGGPIPALFPKGYAAFYAMKYEISQGQYADFLNTLTSDQASEAGRYPNKSGTNRHTISGTHPSFSASSPDRACNFLSWADITAYADWAGLRPMTELEFEKVARGPASVVADEYAWGSTSITQAQTISGTENGTETITTSNANCNYGNWTFTGGDEGQGPLRCGIFATASSVRWSAGAGYYGAMELSGNLWELVVPIGNTKGRAFTGLHGDGAIDAAGDANVTDWPQDGEEEDDFYTGLRGGNFALEAALARVAFRLLSTQEAVYRHERFGGRLVRTAP